MDLLPSSEPAARASHILTRRTHHISLPTSAGIITSIRSPLNAPWAIVCFLGSIDNKGDTVQPKAVKRCCNALNSGKFDKQLCDLGSDGNSMSYVRADPLYDVDGQKELKDVFDIKVPHNVSQTFDRPYPFDREPMRPSG